MPLLLYIATSALVLWLVHRYVRPISVVAALVLLAVPLGLTGRALVTGDVYGPIDHPYRDVPLASLASTYDIGSTHNASATDVVSEFFPWRLAVQQSLRRGEWPLWNPYNLSGLPLAAQAQSAPYSPFTLLACLLPAAAGMSYTAAMALFVAAVSAFLLARELGMGEGPALFAAIGWSLSASIVLYSQTAMGFATAYLPLLLAATRRVLDRPGVAAGAFLTTALVLTSFAGHPESLFLNVLVSCAYALFELIRRRGPMRAIATALMAGVAALLLTAISVLPLLDALSQSIELRQKSVRRIPDISPAGQLAGIATDFFPHLHVRGWQSPPLSYINVETAAVGSLVLALAVYAVWRKRSAETWFFAGVVVFGVLAGAGWPPLVNTLRALPVLRVTLTPRFAFSAALALVLLAAYGLELLVRRSDFKAAAATCASVLLLLSGGMFWLSRHVVLGDPDYGRHRILAELLFLGIALALLVLRIPLRWLVPAFVVLLCVQRWVSENDTFRTFPKETAYPRLAVLEPLQRVHGPYRITGKKGAFPPAMNIFYGLEDPRGYEAMTYAAYWHTFPLWSGPHGVWYNHVESLEAPFLSFLNVRFAIQDQADDVPAGWHVVTTANGAKLLENDRVIDRIFVPQQVALTAMTPEEVVVRMGDVREFREIAWVNTPGAEGVHGNGPGRITLRERSRGGAYTFDADMQQEGWVVISDVAWKGWRATVDGREAVLHRANAAFLSVFVPRGHHRVRLTYLPSSFVAGAAISLATLAALGAWGTTRGLRRAGAAGGA